LAYLESSTPNLKYPYVPPLPYLSYMVYITPLFSLLRTEHEPFPVRDRSHQGMFFFPLQRNGCFLFFGGGVIIPLFSTPTRCRIAKGQGHRRQAKRGFFFSSSVKRKTIFSLFSVNKKLFLPSNEGEEFFPPPQNSIALLFFLHSEKPSSLRHLRP